MTNSNSSNGSSGGKRGHLQDTSVKNAREVAAEALARVLDDDAWGAPALSSVLDASALSERDKAFATELFYGALRFAGPLEVSLLRGADKPGRGLDGRIRPHLIIAAYQLQHMSDRVPAHAVVDAAVNAVKRARPGLDGFTNALLRRLGSSLSALLTPTSPLADVALAWGVPLSLAQAITAKLPKEEHAAAVAGLSDRAAVWAVSFALPAGETQHRFAPGLVEVPGGRASNLPGYKDGGYVVVDPSAVVVCAAAGNVAGRRVLDLCAAPGHRSVMLRKAGADVTAVELSPRRAKKVAELCKREHVEFDVVVGDVVGDALDKVAPADVVVLDAPGTSLGATRRKPEIKLRRNEDAVKDAVKLQAKLLSAAAKSVKAGGALVYAVCSPLPDEGAHQIEAFLAGHPDFVRDDLSALLPWLPKDAVDGDGAVQLLPHKHDADAVFVARLRRRG